jgi:glycosyltransferase involved in cell wall biosynthesis
MTFASPFVRTDPGSGFRRSGTSDAGAGRPNGVTIVIPNWNHRAFLPRSIRSARAAVAALGEMGVPAEVVVIDDASRDGSARQLRSLSHFYGWDDVSTVFLEENQGLCAVRNLGLHVSRYRYGLFLDADNEVDPVGVVALYRAARATGAILSYGNLLDIRAGEAIGIRSNEAPTNQLTVDNYIDALALVDVDEAIAVGGYTTDRQLQYWADWEFLLHLVAEESLIVFVPVVVGRYHVVPLSMLAVSATVQKDDRHSLRRTYWQTGSLDWNRAPLGRVYHPEVGYLDEGWAVHDRV